MVGQRLRAATTREHSSTNGISDSDVYALPYLTVTPPALTSYQSFFRSTYGIDNVLKCPLPPFQLGVTSMNPRVVGLNWFVNLTSLQVFNAIDVDPDILRLTFV